MAILDENEFIKVDGRGYLNPQIALDESNAFVDNLRSAQQSDNQKIQMDTRKRLALRLSYNRVRAYSPPSRP